ncbi:MAG: hypothetical protein ABFS23_09530 [Pseudomonadota bacterium]
METQVLIRAVAGLLCWGSCHAESAAPVLNVCLDYGCDKHRAVRPDSAAWKQVKTLLSDPASPAAERRAAARALGLLEHSIGQQTGTHADLPGNSADHGRIGQLDCIAESTNSDTYLRAMQQAGLLRHHRVGRRQVRRPLLFDTHWTAVLEEAASGKSYAMDSWFGANGDPADIIALDDWRRGASPENAP